MTKSQKEEAKFLDTRIDDETASSLSKWNLAILAAALLHDLPAVSIPACVNAFKKRKELKEKL